MCIDCSSRQHIKVNGKGRLHVPPVKVTECDISASIDKLYDIPVNALTPERQIRQGHVPSSVAVIEHLPNLVNRLLISHALILQDEDDVTLFTLDQIFSVRAQVVLPGVISGQNGRLLEGLTM